jgi:hypothetical protein
MSLQGPLVVVAAHPAASLIEGLRADGAFPVVTARPDELADALAAARPSAVLLAEPDATADERIALLLTETVTASLPIVPVIACAAPEQDIPYREALPVAADAPAAIVAERMSSALRVRQLHAAVLNRAALARENGQEMPAATDNDPLEDAAVIVAGRGRDYPHIATRVGERAGLIGALSIEIAARYLKERDADGLIIADGFNPWNAGALLTVLSEDTRFRDLPVGILGQAALPGANGLVHLVQASDPDHLVRLLLPLARLHAFEARLRRLMTAFDSNGVIDPATGLCSAQSFLRMLDRALREADETVTGLSIARFSVEGPARMKADAARLVGRLIRGADFGCQDDDGSALVVFAATGLKDGHGVARRIAAALRRTMLAPESSSPAPLAVTLATYKAGDTPETLLARVSPSAVAAE